MHGVIHTEFLVKDLTQSAKFFETLFDWKIRPFGEDYSVWSNGEEGEKASGGGLTTELPEGTKTITYIEVADIATTVAKIRELGGTILVEYQALPNNMGAWATFLTPDGTPMAIWAPK